jgi:hypothetical protein
MARKGQHHQLTALRKDVEKMGGSLDESAYQAGFVNADAPRGKVWAATGDTHALNVCWAHPGFRYGQRMDEETRKLQGEAVVDAMERVAQGLADCTDEDCDVCPH